MADPDTAELEPRFWKELESARIVMLGLAGGPPQHMQPMAAFGEPEGGVVWFFTRNDTDMARQIAGGHAAMMCVMAKDMEFQACVHGVLTLSHDRARIDKYWSPFIAAWYPKGKDDPALTLLRLDGGDARVWTAKRGGLAYPFEIAKANLTHTLPDVGTVSDVTL